MVCCTGTCEQQVSDWSKFSMSDMTAHRFNYSTRPIAGGTVEPSAAALGAGQPTKGAMFDPAKGSGVGLGEFLVCSLMTLS